MHIAMNAYIKYQSTGRISGALCVSHSMFRPPKPTVGVFHHITYIITEAICIEWQTYISKYLVGPLGLFSPFFFIGFMLWRPHLVQPSVHFSHLVTPVTPVVSHRVYCIPMHLLHPSQPVLGSLPWHIVIGQISMETYHGPSSKPTIGLLWSYCV